MGSQNENKFKHNIPTAPKGRFYVSKTDQWAELKDQFQDAYGQALNPYTYHEAKIALKKQRKDISPEAYNVYGKMLKEIKDHFSGKELEKARDQYLTNSEELRNIALEKAKRDDTALIERGFKKGGIVVATQDLSVKDSKVGVALNDLKFWDIFHDKHFSRFWSHDVVVKKGASGNIIGGAWDEADGNFRIQVKFPKRQDGSEEVINVLPEHINNSGFAKGDTVVAQRDLILEEIAWTYSGQKKVVVKRGAAGTIVGAGRWLDAKFKVKFDGKIYDVKSDLLR